MNTRLGLDIGTNSIGWFLYETDGDKVVGVLDGGVRIFSDGRDPKSGASLAVDRRAARAMRRRRDRYLRRRTALMRKLAEAGLMPADPVEAKALEALDPYALRARGLDEPLPLHHLGRALFHLNQRRGFKSNRKTDRGDNESGKIKDATRRLDFEMARAIRDESKRTYGAFLHMRRAAAPDPRRAPSVRTRLTVARRDASDKEEAGYDFYPDRRHLEEEFEKLWDTQVGHHPDVLTDDLKAVLFEIVFYQRPLKAPEVGLCLFAGIRDVPADARRLPKAHPLTQRRVLYETVNNLRVTSDGRERRALTREERDNAIKVLDSPGHIETSKKGKSKVTLKTLGQRLKLPPGARFTLETANRDAIACDPVRASLSHPDRFGPRWSTLSEADQWRVVRRITRVQSEDCARIVVDWLRQRHGLAEQNAWSVLDAPMPDGYARLGHMATRRLLAELEHAVDDDGAPLTYDKAASLCFGHHSDHRTGDVLDDPALRPDDAKDWEWPLPYYGALLERHVIPGSHDRAKHDPRSQASEFYGRITNPTVHIGLNQLRRLVNRIINTYGKPDQIVVELSRELKMSEQQKTDVNQRNKANRKAAEMRGKKLVEELRQPDTGANRMILRLWEDLNQDDCMRRFCPYTGQRISAGMLFDDSCDIDHILPFSRTLDNSFANRTLCLREANRAKQNYTPHEAARKGLLDWDKIEANLKNLPDNKKWRFAPDAMEQFEAKGDFLDRALVDTQYLSRIARTYLEALYDGADGKRHVFVVPGKLTAMLRAHWGLDSLGWPEGTDRTTRRKKNRNNHLHHAIDAAVLGATTQALVKAVADAAGAREAEGASKVIETTPEPWEHFRSDIRTQLDKIIVSHRADHGRVGGKTKGADSTIGALHEATAFKVVDDERVRTRIPVPSIKPAHLTKGRRSGWLVDPYLRDCLAKTTAGLDGKEFERAVADFFAGSRRYGGTRHVRLERKLQSASRVHVPQDATVPLKAYQGGSNHRFEIWRLPDGKIVAQVVTLWEVHNLKGSKRPHPAAKRLLQIHKGDMVAIEQDGQTVICTVQKSDVANGAFLVPHQEANADQRSNDRSDPFKWFQMAPSSLVKAGTRRVHVDEMGRLRDPGPPG